MLFCKCSSFLDSSGGGYNLMGNIFAQFPISHKFSFTFCVGVILLFCLFFIVIISCLRKYPTGLSFLFFLFSCFFLCNCLFRAWWGTQQALKWRMWLALTSKLLRDWTRQLKVCMCAQTICMCMLNECVNVDISGATVGSFSEGVKRRKRGLNSMTAITVAMVMISLRCIQACWQAMTDLDL